ncbi:MAG: hypothetical protein RhofKO_32970 [Rhodothermales bacterium]
MSSRTRTRSTSEESFYYEDDLNFDLESLSEDELEDLLFEEENEKKENGFFNLPVMAGLSIIMVGIAYLFQEMGLSPFAIDLTQIIALLPWLAGVLIILLGFGVLSWRPKKKKKKIRKAKTVETPSGKKRVVVEEKSNNKARRLAKSRDKKVAGVAAGIAEYFNIDPTIVRIAFVIGTVASGGPFLLAYLLLAMVMPKPEVLTREERITIIRDS